MAKNQSKNEPLARNRWERAITLLALVVAVLAISNDSLLFRLLPKKAFSAAQYVSIGSVHQDRAMLFLKALNNSPDNPQWKEMLVPIQLMMFISIRNESPHTKQITSIRLEFRGDDGTWVGAQCAESLKGLYTSVRGMFDEINVDGVDFVHELSRGPVESHASRAGWIGVNFPEPYRRQDMLQRKFRLRVSTAFDDDEQVALKETKPAPHEVSTVPTGWRPGQTNVDLSALPRVNWLPQGIRPRLPQ
jgi:hypothetical protein